MFRKSNCLFVSESFRAEDSIVTQAGDFGRLQIPAGLGGIQPAAGGRAATIQVFGFGARRTMCVRGAIRQIQEGS